MKRCRYCQLEGHTALMCYARPRRTLVAKKKIRQLGREGQKWLKTRAGWFAANPADHYECYLCGEYLAKSETTLDHKLNRASHPELRHDPNNLFPCCMRCNKDKGSMSYDDFVNKV